MRSKIRTAVQVGHANERRHATKEKVEKEIMKKEGLKDKKSSQIERNKEGKKLEKRNDSHKYDHKTALTLPPNQEKKTEFEVVLTQRPKRLNDVVDAPPDLGAILKKKASRTEAFGKVDVISAEQKRLMEIEREKAIRRYRELKEKREHEKTKSRSATALRRG